MDSLAQILAVEKKMAELKAELNVLNRLRALEIKVAEFKAAKDRLLVELAVVKDLVSALDAKR
jgi:hypothetical protein